VKLKICGITDQANLNELMKVGTDLEYFPDYFGFISYEKSKRYVSASDVPQLFRAISQSIKKVLVVVDISKEKLASYLQGNNFDAIQFHGDETEFEIKEFRSKYPTITVIKAIKVESEDDLKDLEHYSECVDLFLFDAAGGNPGGNGVKFSWSSLEAYTSRVPFFLSGGITFDDFEDVKKLAAHCPQLIGIDVNSGFEDTPGIKNSGKIKNLLRSLKDELSSQ